MPHYALTNNQSLRCVFGPDGRWHCICFIPLENRTFGGDRLLATRCMLAVTPSRGACTADFANRKVRTFQPGFPKRSCRKWARQGIVEAVLTSL